MNMLKSVQDSKMANLTKVIECRSVWKFLATMVLTVVEAAKKGTHDKDQLLKQFGCVVAVADASFEVFEGETFCIMGLSGSGKSTLIRHFNRLIEPSSGEVIVRGNDVCKLNGADLRELRAKHIGMVFQHVALLPYRYCASECLACFGGPATLQRPTGLKPLEPPCRPSGSRIGPIVIQVSSLAACSSASESLARLLPTPKFS